MAARVVIEMTGDEAKYLASLRAAAAGLSGMEQGLKKVTDESAKAAKEENELARAAKRVFDDTRTPMEQYNQRMQQLNTLLEKGKINQEAFARASHQAGEALKQAGESGNIAFGEKAIEGIKTMVGALGVGTGLAGAIELVRKEYETLHQTQKRAAEASMSVADAQIKFLRMSGVETPEERDKLIKSLEGVSARTNTPMKDLYLSGSNAASARGDLPMAKTLESLELAAKFIPEAGGGQDVITGTLQDIMKASGHQDTPKAAGYLAALARQVRIKDMAKIGGGVAPVLMSLLGQGDTPAQAGALFSTLTQGSGDETGERSRTAAITLAKQLGEMLPEKTRYKYEVDDVAKAKLDRERRQAGEQANMAALSDPEYVAKATEIERQKRRLGKTDVLGRQRLQAQETAALEAAQDRAKTTPEYVALIGDLQNREKTLEKREVIDVAGTGLKSTDERIAAVAADPKLRRRIMGELNIEAGATGAVTSLLAGDPKMMGMYKQFQGELADTKENDLAGGFRRKTDTIRGGKIQKTATLGRAIDTGLEAQETSDQGAARSGLLRDKFSRIMQNSGMGYVDTEINSMLAEIGGGGAEQFIARMEMQEQRLRQPRKQVPKAFGMGYDPRAQVGPDLPPTAESLGRANEMREMIDKFNELIATVKQGNEANASKANPTLRAPNDDK
jgi:hypothetical protein